MALSAGATAFIRTTNKLLKEELLVSADQLVTPVRFTTGSLGADVALGGGLPGNQWTEIVGLPSAGKTFFALKTIAANQALNPDFMSLWVAAEHYNEEWAAALGVDNSRVVVVPTMQMEKGLQVILSGLDSKEFDCITLDSFPAMVPDEELAKAMDQFTTAVGARTVGRFLRKAGEAGLRPYDGTGRPFVGLFINQYRDKIGGWAPPGQTAKTTPGGNAKDYFCYARVEIRRGKFISESRPGITEPVVVGQENKIKVIKNKSAAPQTSADIDLYFRRAPMLGFNRGEYDLAKEYVTIGKVLGVIGVSGSWLSFGGERWQSKEKMLDAIREDKELQLALRAETLEAAADPRRLDDMEG